MQVNEVNKQTTPEIGLCPTDKSICLVNCDRGKNAGEGNRLYRLQANLTAQGGSRTLAHAGGEVWHVAKEHRQNSGPSNFV